MLGWWRAFLSDDHDRPDIGCEDIGEVPEMVDGCFGEQTFTRLSRVHAREYGIGQDKPDPTTRAHDLQGKFQEEEVAILLPMLLIRVIVAEVRIFRRQIGRVGKEEIDGGGMLPGESQAIRLVDMQAAKR